MFLPPFTTLVTRLIETTSSFRLSRFASNFFFIIAICCPSFRRHRSFLLPLAQNLTLEFQPSLAGRVRQRLHAAVVEISAAIEDHLLDALLLGAFGDQLADFLGGSDVPAICFAFGIGLLAERRCREQSDTRSEERRVGKE